MKILSFLNSKLDCPLDLALIRVDASWEYQSFSHQVLPYIVAYKSHPLVFAQNLTLKARPLCEDRRYMPKGIELMFSKKILLTGWSAFLGWLLTGFSVPAKTQDLLMLLYKSVEDSVMLLVIDTELVTQNETQRGPALILHDCH